MKTKEAIQYKVVPYGHICTIPKGAVCEPAVNMPPDSVIKFWVLPWPGMSLAAESWAQNYGFGLRKDEVE